MITIIIPTYNEAGFIGATLARLRAISGEAVREVIVVDGGSTDGTVEEALEGGARVVRSAKGRAAQMNAGAAAATTDLLYFLHAETLPPEDFAALIAAAMAKGAVAGCFRLSFDHDHWFLRTNCWFTRFDVQAFRYGDQSLFVRKDVFDAAQGYNERLIVFEDNEIVRRLKRSGPFKILSASVRTSARKYIENGVYRMQAIFYLMYFLYRAGCSQERLLRTYRKLITQDKL